MLQNDPVKSDDAGPSLESLQRRIDTANSLKEEGKHDEVAAESERGLADRATGIAAGAFVGGALGYLLDSWLGISPIGFIVGFFLGFAAGVYNLIRNVSKD